MIIYYKILSLINKYLEYGNVYMEVLEDGLYTEKSLKEELIELFKKYNYTAEERCVEIYEVFESPGMDVIVIYVTYIDKKDKTLKVISDVLYRY